MKSIVIISDYKGFFESKQKTSIYRGGMDLDKISLYFKELNYSVQIIQFKDLNQIHEFPRSTVFLYTSSEDNHGLYKSYIEDVVYNWENKGYRFLPKYAHLKAHNNKVALELLRNSSNWNEIKTIESCVFGTLEELKKSTIEFKYPVVVKTYAGAMSKGVGKADSQAELFKLAAKLSRSANWKHDVKELLRKIKYRKKYVRESFFRKKFVVQNMIPGLDSDWKVLVYGNKCFALHRANRKNDFRASGSGHFQFKENLPEGMLNYAYQIKEYFDVPHISLDIAYDGQKFHLIEFQFLCFGTTTLEKSPFYFKFINGSWVIVNKKSELEKVYVSSIVNYLSNKHTDS